MSDDLLDELERLRAEFGADLPPLIRKAIKAYHNSTENFGDNTKVTAAKNLLAHIEQQFKFASTVTAPDGNTKGKAPGLDPDTLIARARAAVAAMDDPEEP